MHKSILKSLIASVMFCFMFSVPAVAGAGDALGQVSNPASLHQPRIDRVSIGTVITPPPSTVSPSS